MPISEPEKIITPWASTGSKNPIPPESNNSTGAAGFDKGFPDITMTPEEAGGIPPAGQDFNGIFYQITEIIRYIQSGGQPFFNSALSIAIGGYPKGCVILGSDALTLWQNQVDGNTNDPSSLPTGWFKLDVNLKSVLASGSGASMIGRGSSNVDVDIKSLESTLSYGMTCAIISKILAGGDSQKISFYGDSTMYGYKVDMPLPTDQVAVPPPAAFQSVMNELQLPTTSFNRGISNSSLASMLDGTDGSGSTFASKVNAGGIDHDAKVIYCNHAINDSKADSDIKVFKENLITFVTLCRNNGIVPVLVTPNPNPPIFTVTPAASRRLAFFAETIRDVSTEYNVDLVDQYFFFEASQNVEAISTMVPDGIHPSDAMYVQAGRNLAIPLVSAVEMPESSEGVTTFADSSYAQNLTGATFIGVNGRLGFAITSTRGPQPQGINIPVVFKEAVSAFSIYGIESADQDKINLVINGFNAGAFSETKSYGDTFSSDGDYRQVKKAPMHAGLNIISLAFDAVPSIGTELSLSGFGGAPSSFSQVSGNTNGSAQKLDPICAGHTAISKANLSATNELVFTDRSNSPVVKVKNVAGVFTVEIVKDGVVVLSGTSGTPITDGEYTVEMAVSQNSISVSAGIVGVTIPLPKMLPNIYLYTAGVSTYVR